MTARDLNRAEMPKKEGAKEKAANKAQAEAEARAKAAEDASWADDDKGKAKKDGKKVRPRKRSKRWFDFFLLMIFCGRCTLVIIRGTIYPHSLCC